MLEVLSIFHKSSMKGTQSKLMTIYQIKNLKTKLKIPLTEELLTLTTFTAKFMKHLPFSGSETADKYMHQ